MTWRTETLEEDNITVECAKWVNVAQDMQC